MKIVHDCNFCNTIWCRCNSEEEYSQFANELYFLKGKIYICNVLYDPDEEWFGKNKKDLWLELFEVSGTQNCDEECEIEIPLSAEYKIVYKPGLEEYPVVINYSDVDNVLSWVSIAKLE